MMHLLAGQITGRERRLAAFTLASAMLSLAFAAPAMGATTFVQGKASSAASTTSLASTYTSNVNAGDGLIAQVRGTGTVSVSDNRNGAWTQLANDTSQGGVGSLWASTNAKAGATTVTVTSSASGYLRIVQSEYSGVGAVDGTAACKDGTATTATTPSVTGTVGDLQFASVGMFDAETMTAGAGSTLRTTQSGPNGSTADEDVLSISSGSGGQSFRLSTPPGNGGWAACVADFKPSSAAGGNGTLLFDGTFTPLSAHWPSVFGGCVSVTSNLKATFNLTTSCDPGGNGHYRTDLCSAPDCTGGGTGDVFQAGTPTCTSIPIYFPNLPTVPDSSWLQFAEAKDAAASQAGWEWGVSSFYGGVNQFAVQYNGWDGDRPPWTGPIPSGWNTVSECDNNANTDAAGRVYGIYLNGVRLTFNHGPATGQQTLSGFAIIDDGVSSWPLDINDYTGGAPVPNTIVHGDPLVATIGSNGLPPEPAGGWTSPHS
jgi:hypothetical protein